MLQALIIGAAPPDYHTEAGFGSFLTYYMLGQLCEEMGDETEAIACYTKTAQLHPEPTPVIARLLRALKCAGRESEIYGWFHAHLPDYTVTKNRILLELLQTEGCNEAAAQLINATEQPISIEVAFNQASEQGRSQIVLADRLLASLSSSATYSPAVKRVRLALPLPKVSE